MCNGVEPIRFIDVMSWFPEKVQWLVHSPEYYTHFANSHGIQVHIIYHVLSQMSNQSPNLLEVTNRDEPPVQLSE